jgi:hypothetical protein
MTPIRCLNQPINVTTIPTQNVCLKGNIDSKMAWLALTILGTFAFLILAPQWSLFFLIPCVILMTLSDDRPKVNDSHFYINSSNIRQVSQESFFSYRQDPFSHHSRYFESRVPVARRTYHIPIEAPLLVSHQRSFEGSQNRVPVGSR